nr:polysaccharide biosynthesis/export family protein [Pseudoflavitalea sp. G-6-1-2]
MTSCVSNKKLTEQSIYFRNVNDSVLRKTVVQYEPRIQKGDILYIVVNTANESSALLLNQPNFYGASSSAGASSSSSGNTITGYLVDDNGTIIFPLIGKLNVAGMTKAALTDTITNKVKQIAVDAIVSVRLLNYRVTVLGEVAKPGTYSIPSERVTILDAIGLAGDLTVFGKRNNIKIMRETDGKREMGTLDLNNGDIFSSPYYFLRQNDIVYVEMNSRKMQNADQTNVRNLSLGLGIISAVSLIITTITRF